MRTGSRAEPRTAAIVCTLRSRPRHLPCNSLSSGRPSSPTPSADNARAAFAAKPRGLVDKVMTVAEAVRRFVHDGDYLATGGFGTNRIPTAVCHEILRQSRQNLGFAGHTATHDFQILCAGNLTGRGQTLAKVDVAYVVGLEARGLSPHARRVMESGTVQVRRVVELHARRALHARRRWACRSCRPAACSAPTRSRTAPAKVIDCPFTGEKLAAIPALYPDVAAIHVHEADRYGNCRFTGTSVADIDLARAAKRLIITCERLVPHDEMRRDPHRTRHPVPLRGRGVRGAVRQLPGQHAGRVLLGRGPLEVVAGGGKRPGRVRAVPGRPHLRRAPTSPSTSTAAAASRLRHLRQRELLLHLGK